jgi:hypothetical protein
MKKGKGRSKKEQKDRNNEPWRKMKKEQRRLKTKHLEKQLKASMVPGSTAAKKSKAKPTKKIPSFL